MIHIKNKIVYTTQREQNTAKGAVMLWKGVCFISKYREKQLQSSLSCILTRAPDAA
jgi:hypothetical protein